MTRFWNQFKTDVRVQFRNKLYHIGIIVSALIAIALSQLVTMSQLGNIFPALIIMIIGGTTMLYVAGMVIFEKNEGTLAATIVTPLSTNDYLLAKVASLVMLATLESAISLGGAMAILALNEPILWPSFPWLLAGTLGIGTLYTLLGIAVVVRYRTITDFLMPMAALAIALQLPFLYFFGLVQHWSLLIVPTSAPTMVMTGAYRELAPWEQIYGLTYTTLLLAVLTIWAKAAFQKHIILKMG